MSDQAPLRIGQLERDEASSRLRAAAEDGRVSAAELDRRLAVVRGATIQDELDSVLHDLPRPLLAPVEPTPAPGMFVPTAPGLQGPPGYSPIDQLMLTATMSKQRRDGDWQLPPFIRVQALLDSVKLNCLFARPAAQVIDLEVAPGAGTVVLVLPEGWSVNTDRLGRGVGSVRVKVPQQQVPGHPIIVARGSLGLGSFVARGPNWFERRAAGLDR